MSAHTAAAVAEDLAVAVATRASDLVGPLDGLLRRKGECARSRPGWLREAMSLLADALMTPAFGFSAPNVDYPLTGPHSQAGHPMGRRPHGGHRTRRFTMVPILYPALRWLLDEGAQLVEVLPAGEYAEMHLPGAVNIPLKSLDAATTTTTGLDRERPVIVYCWDAL